MMNLCGCNALKMNFLPMCLLIVLLLKVSTSSPHFQVSNLLVPELSGGGEEARTNQSCTINLGGVAALPQTLPLL